MTGHSDKVKRLADYREPSERVAPASVDVEQALLGAVLVNPEAYPLVSAIIEPEHFYEPLHRTIWKTITDLADARQTPTFKALLAALGGQASADLGGLSVKEYLARLSSEATSVMLAPEYARTIRDYWALREIESVALRASDGSPYVAATMLSQVLDRIDEVRASLHDREQRSASAGEAARELVEDITTALQNEAPPIPWSGFNGLDEALGGGLQPETLITCAARTGMGKSLFGVEVAYNVARQNFGVVYHTLEMSRAQVVARTISSRLSNKGQHLPYSRIMRKRGLRDNEAERIAHLAHDLKALPLRIEDGGGVTIGEIAATSERRMSAFQKRGIAPGLIVIDHAHIVRPGRRYNREDEGFKEVADGALALAKHLRCCVLLLAQCNRQTESRDDKRPSLADVRGAGAFAEDSDAVLFLYRPAYYIERSPKFREGQQPTLDEHTAVKNDLEVISYCGSRSPPGRPTASRVRWPDAVLVDEARGLAMSELGVFAIDRAIFDHPAFADEPFTEREAWTWMIAEAAWKPRQRRIGSAMVKLKRGQLAASLRFIAERWGWTKSRVERFLKRLKTGAMIETNAETGILIITICNYDKYQRVGLPGETGGGTEDETPPGHRRDSTGTNEKQGNTKPLKEPEAARERARPEDIGAWLRSLVGEEPVLTDPNIHPIVLALEKGATRADVEAGIAAAMADPEFRPKWWRQLAGWVDWARKDRLANQPKARVAEEPCDPEQSRRGYKALVQHFYAGNWSDGWEDLHGGPPGSPRCKIPPDIIAEVERELGLDAGAGTH